MRTNLLSIAGIIVLVVQSAAFLGCSAQSKDDTKSQSSISQSPASLSKPAITHWKYQSEQQWIVDSIGRDIAEMLVFAKYHGDSSVQQKPDSLNFKTTTVDAKLNKYQFQVTLPKTTVPLIYEFVLDRYAWSPATYQPFVQKLIGVLQLKSDATSATPDNFFKILTDANMSDFYKENTRISTALSKAPLDAGLHQQAALLQATFDMLELAGNFSDTRAPLNRICAHLAIAQTLTPNAELNVAGKIADIALESMACRDGVAVSKNDDLAKSQKDPIVLSFLRGLKIRSTGDFRSFDESKQTPLEASQFGMRYANALSSSKAIDYIEAHHCTPQLRWMRIAMAGRGSVGSGHQLDAQIFPKELKDFMDDYEAFNNDTIKSQTQCVDELNKTSTRCLQSVNGEVRLLPLSWGDIAAYHARHIAWAAYREYYFNEHMYGVPEFAASSLKRAETTLFGLNILPLIYIEVPIDDKHTDTNKKFFSGMDNLTIDRPQIIPAYAWIAARFVGEKAKSKVKLQIEPEQWFVPPVPMGTAYYYSHRLSLNTYKPDLAELTRLHTLCPMDESLCVMYAKKKYGEKPNGEQMIQAYGPLADYNFVAMENIANAEYSHPEKYEAQLEKLAKLAPGKYFTLGDYCAQHNESEKAARFYQLGWDNADDHVLASNDSFWLVNYYFDHNQKDKAIEVANDAAGVYSYNGLHCLAMLYERMGEFGKAEKVLVDSKERYEDDEGLTAFYIRNKDKDKTYAEKAEPLIKKAFPNGLEKVDVTQLKAPPTVGVIITSYGPYPERLGFAKGQIVVALDGYRINTREQSQIIRQLTLNQDMKYVVWDGKQYKEIVGIALKDDRRLGIYFDNYPKK